MAVLTHANAQYRIRPAHERYYDVADLVNPLREEFRNLRALKAAQSGIEVAADESTGDITLALPGVSSPVRLTHWSFDRLCRQIDVSPRDLRRYPAPLVAPIIKHQLMHSSGVSDMDADDDTDMPDMDGDIAALMGDAAQQRADDQSRELQFVIGPDKDGGLQARSVFSGSYGSYNPIKLLNDAMMAVERGWRTPRAWAFGSNPYPDGHPQANRIATPDDVMKCSIIKEGDKIGPAGVYRAGDGRNIFIYLASDVEVLPNMYRFVTIEDGEDRSLKAIFGLMTYSCGNHNLWGVANVREISRKHRKGSIAQFRDDFATALDLVEKQTIPVGLYQAAQRKILGVSADAVSDEVFEYARRKQQTAITRRIIDAALPLAEQYPDDHGNSSPHSVLAVHNALTRYSQSVTKGGKHFADQRQSIDRFAGMLLDTVTLEDAPVSASIGATVIDGGIVVSSSSEDSTAPARKRKSKAS